MHFFESNKVAEYLRLSRDDGDKMESDSIRNQRDLIRDYLEQHDDLKHAVRTQIALLIKAETVLSQMDGISEDQSSVKAVNVQIQDSESQIQRYQNLKVQAYKDMLDEVITKEEYTVINARFTQKLEAARKSRQDLMARKKRMLANEVHMKPWMASFKKHAAIEALERSIGQQENRAACWVWIFLLCRNFPTYVQKRFDGAG